jgi:flagellin
VRVNANVAAMTTVRGLDSGDRAVQRSLERLSSGARINRAADDAGGLSISEGLRSRFAGMRQAVRNTRDGIDVVRTAEGALAQSTSLLQRMRDLSVQAANDGGLDAAARGTVQKELDQLSREITRIATTTAYAGTKLLDGSYRGTFQVGAEVGETIDVAIGDLGRGLGAIGLGLEGIDVTRAASTADGGGGGGAVLASATITPAVSAAEGVPAAGSIALAGDFQAAATFRGLTGSITYDGRTIDLAAIDYTGDLSPRDHFKTFETAVSAGLGLDKKAVVVRPGELVITGAVPGPGSTAADGQRLSPTYVAAAPPTAPTTPTPDPTPPTPGDPTPPTPGDPAPTTPPAASEPPVTPTPPAVAIVGDDVVRAIDAAIARISTTRAHLGAVENRLERSGNRLGAAYEDTMAAYSRIRDTDMARETTGLSRNQVLLQAGTAMLAQANQRPQAALRLLS